MKILSFFRWAILAANTILIVASAVFLYKTFNWERTDILNITSLTASVIAIVALIFNARQYSLNKDKRLYEIGEFRLEKVYTPRLNRIHDLNINLYFKGDSPERSKGWSYTHEIFHVINHHVRSHVMDRYPRIYYQWSINKEELIKKKEPEFLSYIRGLNSVYESLYNYSVQLSSFHKQHLEIIEDIRKDENISPDQKESFISTLLIDKLLSYGMIVNNKNTFNFVLVSKIKHEPEFQIETIGYIDYMKSILPSKARYEEALGKEYSDLFEKYLPKG